MTDPKLHLTMAELLALRDGDRSEPAFAAAAHHLDRCTACRDELDALHQRTARLRALGGVAPGSDQLVRFQDHLNLRQIRRRRVISLVGMAAAAILVLGVVGRNLMVPSTLDAEQRIASAISDSQQLEQTLRNWAPDSRVMDGRTALVVIEIEDRIAAVDAQLQVAARLRRQQRIEREVSLWQERVGLMNALVDVHLTKANNVDL